WRQTLGPETIQPQFVIKMTKQPARAPLTWPAQLNLREIKAHRIFSNGVGRRLGRGKQFGGVGRRLGRLGQLSGTGNLESRFPVEKLLLVQLAQIQDVALDDFITGATFVFDDAPVAVWLAIFLSRRATQKHN